MVKELWCKNSTYKGWYGGESNKINNNACILKIFGEILSPTYKNGCVHEDYYIML